MFSIFRMGPDVDCVISIVLFRVTKSFGKKLGNSCTTKINHNVAFSITIIIGIFSTYQDFSNLDT